MPVSSAFWSLENAFQLVFMVSATGGVVLWIMQWHHAKRLPKPFPGWLHALTGGYAVFALGNWIWSWGPTGNWFHAAPWMVVASAAALAVILPLHHRSMQRILGQTIPSTDGRFIEEIILSQSLLQISKNKALQDTLRKSKREHLRTQMNPHFLFNVLTGIQHLIMQGDTERASELFRRFRHLLMQGFLSAEDHVGTLEQELQHVESYLDLESVRVSHRISWDLDIAADVDPGTTPCPLFIVQPLVENAIWHGLGGGTLADPRIRIVVRWGQEDDLVIQVSDNGRGMEAAAAVREKKHQSRGTSIIKERLSLLSHGGHLSMDEQLPPPLLQGVTSTLRLHHWRGYAHHAAGA